MTAAALPLRHKHTGRHRHAAVVPVRTWWTVVRRVLAVAANVCELAWKTLRCIAFITAVTVDLGLFGRWLYSEGHRTAAVLTVGGGAFAIAAVVAFVMAGRVSR